MKTMLRNDSRPALLVAALLGLPRFGLGTRLLSLGLVSGDIPLRAGLTLLGATFVLQVLIVHDGPRYLFRLAFDIFDRTAHGGLRTGL
jgi:hypothetical protein